MMKFSLLAGAMLIASPALAQQTPTPAPAAPTAPASTDATLPSASDPMAAQTTPAAPASADAAATTQPATSTDQIAQVVETDFAKYDADANGTLSTAEFGGWMAALRAATDASVKPDSAEMKAWSKAAFAQADADKSKTVSKTELTTFLAKGKG